MLQKKPNEISISAFPFSSSIPTIWVIVIGMVRNVVARLVRWRNLFLCFPTFQKGDFLFFMSRFFWGGGLGSQDTVQVPWHTFELWKGTTIMGHYQQSLQRWDTYPITTLDLFLSFNSISWFAPLKKMLNSVSCHRTTCEKEFTAPYSNVKCNKLKKHFY